MNVGQDNPAEVVAPVTEYADGPLNVIGQDSREQTGTGIDDLDVTPLNPTTPVNTLNGNELPHLNN